MIDDGNVDIDLSADEGPLKSGDALRLKRKYLGKGYQGMVPRQMIDKIGWPNLFYIEKVGVSEDGEPAVILSACCYNLTTKKGEWRCKGHPASFFEKIKPEVVVGEDRPRRKGDRTASVVTPLGEVASFEYLEDEENPGLILKVFGQRFKANGVFLRQVVEFAKQKGLA